MRQKFRDVAQVMVMENLVSGDDCDTDESNGVATVLVFLVNLALSYQPQTATNRF